MTKDLVNRALHAQGALQAAQAAQGEKPQGEDVKRENDDDMDLDLE